MNPSLLFDLVIAFGVSFFTAQGRPEAVEVLRKLREAKQSGANVDDYMAEVARTLTASEVLDWTALNARIDATVADFLTRSGEEN